MQKFVMKINDTHLFTVTIAKQFVEIAYLVLAQL